MEKQVAPQNQNWSRTRICSRPLFAQYLHTGLLGNCSYALHVQYAGDIALTVLAPCLGKWYSFYHMIALLLMCTWLIWDIDFHLRRLRALSSTWKTVQPISSWMSKYNLLQRWSSTHIRHISGICLDRSLSLRTHLYIRRKSHHKWHSTSSWPVLDGELLESSKNILPSSCIHSGRVLRPSVVLQRSHQARQRTFKQVNVYSHRLPMRHTHLFLADSIWYHPPATSHSASCLKLYTKALNPKHVHETLYLKPSPKRFRSRKLLCSFVELLSTTGVLTTPILPAFQSFIPAFGPQPPYCDLPRNASIQLAVWGPVLVDLRQTWK